MSLSHAYTAILGERRHTAFFVVFQENALPMGYTEDKLSLLFICMIVQCMAAFSGQKNKYKDSEPANFFLHIFAAVHMAIIVAGKNVSRIFIAKSVVQPRAFVSYGFACLCNVNVTHCTLDAVIVC